MLPLLLVFIVLALTVDGTAAAVRIHWTANLAKGMVGCNYAISDCRAAAIAGDSSCLRAYVSANRAVVYDWIALVLTNDYPNRECNGAAVIISDHTIPYCWAPGITHDSTLISISNCKAF